MTNQDTIGWGILGCGDVTEVKSGPAFNKVSGSRLVAVMRRNRAAAEDYARRHGVPNAYSDAEALIHDPEINAVYIATPPGSHAELALQVAAAGKPCYVEKPMARNTGECDAMINAFAKAELPLFVAYYRRALPQFRRMRDLIESKRFGALQQIDYTFANRAQHTDSEPTGWRFDPDVSGGGLFWDLGSHALDLFDDWGGPLDRVAGLMTNLSGRGKVEELVTMQAQCANGGLLSASWNFASSESIDRVTLRFEHASVHGSVFGPPELRIQRPGSDAEVEPFEKPENIQLPLIANVVAALQGRESALSTGLTARRTNRVIDAVARGGT